MENEKNKLLLTKSAIAELVGSFLCVKLLGNILTIPLCR